MSEVMNVGQYKMKMLHRLNFDTLIIQYNVAIRKERDGEEEEKGLVLDYSCSWMTFH